MENKINTVVVCGAGTMGSGIAQVCVTAGYRTILYEPNESVLANAEKSISNNLSTLVDKGKLTIENKEAITASLRFTSDISACKADLVIEAIVEKPEIKASLFQQLASLNSTETIFASNTSSLSISAIAEQINQPERFAGLHFFNPAPLMKLVEVIIGKLTADATKDLLVAFTKSLGKTPVVCKDSPGFIVNRVARPYYIESLRLAEEGVAMETIDVLLESRGFKLGPFKLMDLIGNDVNFAVSCSVYQQLGQPERLKPSFIQEEKVNSGELGRKTNKGYYSYEAKN